MKRMFIEVLNSLYDLRLFLKYKWKVGSFKTKNQYVAFLTKQYHTVEKGLALPNPREGFGQSKIKDIIKYGSEYLTIYGTDSLMSYIKSVLVEYVDFHSKKENHFSILEDINEFINQIKEQEDPDVIGGYRYLEYELKGSFDFESFFKGRHSHRMFTEQKVDQSVLNKAVDIAKYTPSVCNRQGWKVHFYQGEQLKKIIVHQNGNRGFTDQIRTLAIVTGDVEYFSDSERNQIGIDSGMFSMSLILACHSLGLATCALNACVSCKKELEIKSLAKIPNSHKLIMFIAIGYPVDRPKIAVSGRRKTDSFISFHS